MKLALCLEYPIGFQGGVSVLVDALLGEYSRRGHEIVLVSADTEESFRQHPTSACVSRFIPWEPSAASRTTSAMLARQLANANVSLAHFHLGGNFGWANRFPFMSPMAHARTLNIPCVSTSHLVVDILNGYCGPQKPVWFKVLMLPLAWCGKMHQLSNVRAEIAVSQHDFNKLRRWYAPLRGKFVQIYHSRLMESQTAGLPTVARQPVILNVGHIAWRKGQEVLAEAFARIAVRNPEWKLELVGPDGGDGAVERIRRIAKKHALEDRIILPGSCQRPVDFMRRASIYVQPSFWEALGLALQEAMFWGCPAIGSRAGGIPELITEGRTGYLVEPGNVGQLADALQRLIENPATRSAFGAAAPASIREKAMTQEAMVANHLELYHRLLS